MKYFDFLTKIFLSVFLICSSCTGVERNTDQSEKTGSELENNQYDYTHTESGNPVFPGWYADPEIAIYENKYWIFPTFSAPYEEQLHMDAFSSEDLVNWKKHSNILDTTLVRWVRKALWAPSTIKKDGRYYIFFGANDIQSPVSPWWNPDIHTEGETGGIGIAVADKPQGPYEDYLGKPLINEIHHGAQPIDQFVFRDHDGKHYLIYGGWGHCNIGMLNDDFTGFVPFEDGTIFRSITPKGYVEGSFMFIRNDQYYFMWSEGDWTGPEYSVAYAIGDSPFGPFERIGKVLEQDSTIATGAGHHSVLNIPGTDEWYIVYHRRPLHTTDGNHRVVCVDKMFFDEKGHILPVIMTNEGVGKRKLNE